MPGVFGTLAHPWHFWHLDSILPCSIFFYQFVDGYVKALFEQTTSVLWGLLGSSVPGNSLFVWSFYQICLIRKKASWQLQIMSVVDWYIYCTVDRDVQWVSDLPSVSHSGVKSGEKCLWTLGRKTPVSLVAGWCRVLSSRNTRNRSLRQSRLQVTII